MASLSDRPPLFFLVVLSVALGILSAAAVVGMAVAENLRFARASDRLYQLMSTVHSVAGDQKGFATVPGENLWDALVQLGQIDAASQMNPWGGSWRLTTENAADVRLETDLPAHACRRMVSDLLAHKPQDMGIDAMQAQADGVTGWAVMYPLAVRGRAVVAPEIACGRRGMARLDLFFRSR